MEGFVQNLQYRSCDSYLKDEEDREELRLSVRSSCGCSLPIPTLGCRDLNVVSIPDPICYSFRLTCKQTATEACKTSVKEFAKIWITVPTKDDEDCFCKYKETKLVATSCS